MTQRWRILQCACGFTASAITEAALREAIGEHYTYALPRDFLAVDCACGEQLLVPRAEWAEGEPRCFCGRALPSLAELARRALAEPV